MLTDFTVIGYIFLTILAMAVIWRASDWFETASEFVGRNLTDGVRGATINAIASSIPELFTTIFFLLLLKDANGFAGGVGTTAGSAIFNGMIIPALVIMAVLFLGIARSIYVSRRVILRDGIALILCEIFLILILSNQTLDWWHGLLLMVLYALYVAYMLRNMRRRQLLKDKGESSDPEEEEEPEVTANGPIFPNAILKLDLERLIIGDKPINDRSAWILLIVSTAIIAAACFLLVDACETLSVELRIPIYYVAVLIAAAATSVPDTVISIRDGLRGHYDDAIANALGSNIFDICFALGFPVFLYTLIYGQIELPGGSGDIGELRLILLIMTTVALLVYIIGRKMSLVKAILLVGLYILFVIYIVSKGFEQEWAIQISDFLQGILSYVDQLF